MGADAALFLIKVMTVSLWERQVGCVPGCACGV